MRYLRYHQIQCPWLLVQDLVLDLEAGKETRKSDTAIADICKRKARSEWAPGPGNHRLTAEGRRLRHSDYVSSCGFGLAIGAVRAAAQTVLLLHQRATQTFLARATPRRRAHTPTTNLLTRELRPIRDRCPARDLSRLAAYILPPVARCPRPCRQVG